jgi:hypothetical protein
LVCTPFATSTAPTMPSTAISTRSCAEDGFPATWTRTATGSCVAPVVYTAPVATAPPATTGPVATAPPAAGAGG